MTKYLFLPVIIFFSLSSNAQFKIISNGEARLWTNNMGPWDNSMITYSNNAYSKAYVVDRNGSHTFYVRGDGCVYSRGSYINSDINLKKDIKNLVNIDSLYLLQAKTYKFISKQDSTALTFKGINGGNLDSISDDSDLKQYGFIAQEVEEVYPELVSEDENGLLSINYVAFIPLIIEAVKQQKKQIDTLQEIVYSQELELIKLKRTIENCFENENKSKLKSSSIYNETSSIDETIYENAKLFDNVPNPFSLNTEIKFDIPENSISARLIIHDMQGVELRSFDISQKGFGSITINGSELKAGMYLYTLLIDNKIIETKRMLLTKE